MKKTLLLICLAALTGKSFAQKSRILTAAETKDLMEDAGNTRFPPYRVYEYEDNQGVFNLLLCEQQTAIKGKDTLHARIEALCYLNDHGGWLDQWSIYDLTDSGRLPGSEPEQDIHFWTRYCTVTDLDKDRRIDPVMVYGTQTGYGVRRVRIILYYKGKKYAIRATECDLDDCRTFKKDDAIQTLPKAVRDYLDALLERIRREQDVLLKNG